MDSGVPTQDVYLGLCNQVPKVCSTRPRYAVSKILVSKSINPLPTQCPLFVYFFPFPYCSFAILWLQHRQPPMTTSMTGHDRLPPDPS
ncbi:hypothetical protein ASPZODRAFT_435870 [Penicilliopsis zonata CBS 506.65]|uniref:Uncharacterized protein n=1 Tax=Penicilliopsis zonata CBS 506.65 TaxID=1073090 RepID=A0A1L9SWN8_9EURO|nr:hypothetical protein ASPZODRAFT_435870 [Penicilliopsis zonata CBS 506.65]OJJ51622.1 hypothetical protein ASPZODRAFT_435870 [Penicilliopsis zonata CBS 506.65]